VPVVLLVNAGTGWLLRGQSPFVRLPSWRTVLALVAATVVVAVAGGVIWLIHASDHPVDTATVAAGDLAAVALAVTILMALAASLRKGRLGTAVQDPTRLAAAAERLAEEMADRWQREASARRIATAPAPVTVRWRWAADDMAAPRIEVAASPVPGTAPRPMPAIAEPGQLLGSGVVTRLHDEVYARLPRGRLVLVGGQVSADA
jgi:hypothetical protein